MEMKQFGENVMAEEGAEIEQTWVASWRRALDNDPLGSLLAKIDPLVQTSKAAVVGLLISSRDQSAPSEIADADERMAEIFNSPGMAELQSDPAIRKLIKEGNYISLLQHPRVREVSRDSDLKEMLYSFDIAGSVEKALYSTEGEDRPKVRKRIPKRLWRPKEESNQ